MKIKKINAREILDSRGFPTVECCLGLSNGNTVCAAVPSGASVGKFEALELRDKDASRFGGKGVLSVVQNIEGKIAPLIIDKVPCVASMDNAMNELDGTSNKSVLGANAILAVSIAVARAQAIFNSCELYELLADLAENKTFSIPKCMFNFINGGLHADSGLAFQEFMIIPTRDQDFLQTLNISTSIYRKLKKILSTEGLSTSVGDEGGFAPALHGQGLERERLAIQLLSKAVEAAGCKIGVDVVLAMDVAASTFYDEQTNKYKLHDDVLTSSEMVDLYSDLTKEYAIKSIEDGLNEEDWSGWSLLSEKLGNKIQLVGDDIFVTNVQRIQKGLDLKIANSVLIKPNQIGTVSETIKAIKLCQKNGYKTVISHRSGETNDSFIADLAVGTNAKQLKTGACARGERVAKYNRLLEIEKKLGK